MHILRHSFVRSLATSDEGVGPTKPDDPDVSLPSPVESEISSHAEWVLCNFIATFCYLFTRYFSSSPQVASSNSGSVMLTPCPDPALAEYYEGLPTLPYVFGFDFVSQNIYLLFIIRRVCEVKSFSGSSDSLRTTFEEKCGRLAPDTRRLVVILFVIVFRIILSNTSSVPGWSLKPCGSQDVDHM